MFGQTEEVYCAFLDILGFKKIMNDWDKAVSYYQNIMDVYNGSVQVSQLVKEAVENSLKKEKNEEEIELDKNKIKFKVISDSIIVTSKQLLDLIHFIGTFQQNCFRQRYWLRGGIAFGRHAESNQNGNYFIVSEALRDAYLAETEFASYPRIVIHPNSLKKIEQDALNSTLMLNYSKYFIQSADNIWFVNPFFYQGDWDSKYFAKIIEKEARLHSNPHIQKKYLDLADLHNFLNTQGFISRQPKIYYEDASRFLNSLKQVKETLVEEIIPTWEMRDNYEMFYMPSGYEVNENSFGQGGKYNEKPFFQKTFDENKNRFCKLAFW